MTPKQQLAQQILSEILGINLPGRGKNRDKENAYNGLLKMNMKELKSFYRLNHAKG